MCTYTVAPESDITEGTRHGIADPKVGYYILLNTYNLTAGIRGLRVYLIYVNRQLFPIDIIAALQVL